MITNEIKIEVSIAGAKAFVGRITGPDAQYGFALEFLPKSQISRTLAKATITEPGYYRVSAGAVAASRRIDTGFIRVDEFGKIAEIQKSEVVL